MKIENSLRLVLVFFVIIIGLIVAWDTYCAINATEGDTISELLRGWNRSSYGAVCLAWAALGWHLFWTTQAWRAG